MKSCSRYFSITVILFLLGNHFSSFSQVTSSNDTSNYPFWTTMMQDINANFYSTQSAFEKYWANRTDYKGNGWKVFKRWEYINRDRVLPDGKLQPPDYVKNEYLKYANLQKSVSGAWTQIGPISLPANSTSQPNGLGRINTIGFHPTDANTFYIGSPSGGFWKTSDGGTTWTVLSASMPTLGVSAILVHPATPDIIWIGTGDRDAGDAPGMGVYKSTDGGSTWNSSNSGMGSVTVGMLIMHPSDPNIILAATSGGIYKSTNGGSAWTRKSSNTSTYKDIKFKPGDPTIVYATENGNFYRSTNTGDSWTQISITVSGSRLVIGVSPANSAYVYLMQTNGVFAGILRSADSGLTFTTQSTTPNIMDYACDGSGTSSQAWYDLCIAVDPNNANILYLGGINIWKSINGGTTLTINTHWVGSSWGTSCAPSVHADIHSLNFSPVDGKLYTGCDGGIYRTANAGTTWSDLSGGLGIAQVYKIGQSATNSGITINGYQDNGTATCNGSAFTTVIGGDGMECIIDYTNSNYKYGALYYGDIRRSTGSGYSKIAANGTNGITESGNWVTPYILHNTDPNIMYVGYKNVWRSNNVKASSASSVTWTVISSGETSTCTVLEQSPANNDILYVVRSGQLKRSENANAATPTWISCTLPGGYTPTDLEAHPTLANIVYATAQYKVYKSIDKGVTWTNISGNLPLVYTNCLVYDKNTNEGLYVGNETSIYYKDETMSNWVTFGNGLPVVDVRELEIYYDATPSNNRIKAATYGRGLWQSDLIETAVANPSNLAAVPVSTSQINLTWTKNTNNNDVMVAWSPAGTFGTPVTGTTYAAGSLIPGGSTVIYTGNASAYAHTGLTPNTLYYYKAWSYDGTHKYSSGSGTDTSTLCAKITSFPWNEGFENGGASPGCWSQEQISSSGIYWTFITGNGSANPATTHGGTYNACLKDATPADNKTKLISPSFDITSLLIPQLTFWHTQPVWGSNQDQLTVYYKTSSGGSWTVLATFPGSITSWTQEAINLPNASNDYFIAFEGNAKNGYGICIDDVSIKSTTPTLTVTPPDRPVTSAAGNSTFTVISNSAWTALSNQLWCTVTPSGFGNGTITAVYAENTNTSPRVANVTVTVAGLTPVVVTVSQAGAPLRTFNLTVFLEGLYTGLSTMRPAMDEVSYHWGASIADKLTIELHDGSNYSNIVYTATNVSLNTNGTSSFTLPSSYNGNYYVTIRHRNHILTATAFPVSFNTSTVNYNFDLPGKAFGNNLGVMTDGKYVFYAGDVNQDGLVDGTDLSDIDNRSTLAAAGYLPEDVNGDGLVDGSDLSVTGNNADVAIGAVTP